MAPELHLPNDDATATTRLSAAATALVGRERAAAVLGPERAAWLGELVEAGVGDGEDDRYLLDLELRVSEHAPRVVFRKAAYVEVGRLGDPAVGPLSLPITWRAASLQPLFPVFAGTLRWSDGELTLDGFYAPPGGGFGIVADRLLLNVAARGTARWLLQRISAAMRGEAG
jgi:hypothetical protein